MAKGKGKAGGRRKSDPPPKKDYGPKDKYGNPMSTPLTNSGSGGATESDTWPADGGNWR